MTQLTDAEAHFTDISLPYTTITKPTGAKVIEIDVKDKSDADFNYCIRFRYDPSGAFEVLQLRQFRLKARLEPTV